MREEGAMRVVITGGAGFVGKKLAQRLLAAGELGGERVDEIVLFDVAAADLPQDKRLTTVVGDIADAAMVKETIGRKTGTVFHLAAVVSAQAEAEFDTGVRINLEGTRAVLEACRAAGNVPKLLFASSIAVYGGDMPEEITDATALTPQTSYGTQKAIGELLVTDYSRKGFVDGRALRLPTIVVRPGRPNRAASTFASSIIREPLSGVEAVCPVRPDSWMPLMSPRRLIEALLRAHDLPAEAFGYYRGLLLPGLNVTVKDMAEAVRRAGGEEAYRRIKWQPDPVIQKIVDGWPRKLRAEKAPKLGIEGDRSMDDLVTAFIEDDLPAQKAMVTAGRG
jgi:nucleoside-diphosphate-sugar epimerase